MVVEVCRLFHGVRERRPSEWSQRGCGSVERIGMVSGNRVGRLASLPARRRGLRLVISYSRRTIALSTMNALLLLFVSEKYSV